MAEKKQRLRAEIPRENTWDLTHLYPSDQAWEEAGNQLKDSPARIAAYRGRLGQDGRQLLELLRLEDALALEFQRLSGYANRKLDEDTTNGTYQAYSDQAQALYTEYLASRAFEAPEILAIPEETLEAFYRQVPGLEDYRLAIQRIRILKPHTLSEGEEKLLAMANEMAMVSANVYEALSDVDLTFPDAVDSGGEAHLVTQGTYVPLQRSQDRALRRSAYESLYHTYQHYIDTFAATLAGQVKQLRFHAKARHFKNSMEASLMVNEVPTQVYTNLIEAVHANLEQFHRYVALRKRVLGLEEMHMYDMYVSFVKDVKWTVTYEEAKELVLKGLAPLGEEYVALLKKGFQERWVDVYENKGKRSGAYSAGSRPHPYVLLNFQGTLEDVFTLAHEMGHALHSYLSGQTQPVAYSDYVLFVAEVASTCNEALLMQYLLKTTTEPRARTYLLNHFLEQFRATLYRQTQFAEFELRINQMADAGESLTAEGMSKLYGEINRQYFGDAVVTDELISTEWARIPHFYYDYYVYQYATSFAASVALSGRILEVGRPAVEDYLKFLSSGSSADPITLLRRAGVDMATAAPINQALELFGKLLDEMEELMK